MCRWRRATSPAALESYQARCRRRPLANPIPATPSGSATLVSYHKVGDVQAAQGDLAGALNSYQASLAIVERLAKSDPGNASGSATSVSYEKSATCRWRRAICRRH